MAYKQIKASASFWGRHGGRGRGKQPDFHINRDHPSAWLQFIFDRFLIYFLFA